MRVGSTASQHHVALDMDMPATVRIDRVCLTARGHSCIRVPGGKLAPDECLAAGSVSAKWAVKWAGLVEQTRSRNGLNG